MNAFSRTVTDTGASVVFVQAPPMMDPAWNTRILNLNAMAQQVAASYPNVSIATKPRNEVSNAGAYAATKTCLRSETAAEAEAQAPSRFARTPDIRRGSTSARAA